jgi:predicted transcriptional regulator
MSIAKKYKMWSQIYSKEIIKKKKERLLQTGKQHFNYKTIKKEILYDVLKNNLNLTLKQFCITINYKIYTVRKEIKLYWKLDFKKFKEMIKNE